MVKLNHSRKSNTKSNTKKARAKGAKLTPQEELTERRRTAARKAIETIRQRYTPEQISERARKAARKAIRTIRKKYTAEEISGFAKKAWETRRKMVEL